MILGKMSHFDALVDVTLLDVYPEVVEETREAGPFREELLVLELVNARLAVHATFFVLRPPAALVCPGRFVFVHLIAEQPLAIGHDIGHIVAFLVTNKHGLRVTGAGGPFGRGGPHLIVVLVSHAIIVCLLPRCVNHSFRESFHFL